MHTSTLFSAFLCEILQKCRGIFFLPYLGPLILKYYPNDYIIVLHKKSILESNNKKATSLVRCCDVVHTARSRRESPSRQSRQWRVSRVPMRLESFVALPFRPSDDRDLHQPHRPLIEVLNLEDHSVFRSNTALNGQGLITVRTVRFLLEPCAFPVQ